MPQRYLGKSPASGKRGSGLVKAHMQSTVWKLSSSLSLLPPETTQRKFFTSVNTRALQRGYLKCSGFWQLCLAPRNTVPVTRGAPQRVREAQWWAVTSSVLLSLHQPGPAQGSAEDLDGETESGAVLKGIFISRDCFFNDGCAYHAAEGLCVFLRAGKGQAEGRGALGRIPAGLGPRAAMLGIAALYGVPAPLVMMAKPTQLCLGA